MPIPLDPPAIAVRGLRKSYREQTVLHGIDLDVAPGTVYCLLGPNGAGKTTAVNILTTLIRTDAGEVRVAGHSVTTEPDAVRAAIGVTGQFSAIDRLLTGAENLALMADLRHLPRAQRRRRAEELLAHFDLSDAADRRAATYSGGMMRRLDLAMSLVGAPRSLFLDEPTSGLDPLMEEVCREVIREGQQRDGRTVRLSSHILAEVEALCDRVTIIRDGRTVETGTLAQLRHLTRTSIEADLSGPADGLANLPGVHGFQATDGRVTFDVDTAQLEGALRALAEAGVRSLVSQPPTLEELFLRHYAAGDAVPAAVRA